MGKVPLWLISLDARMTMEKGDAAYMHVCAGAYITGPAFAYFLRV